MFISSFHFLVCTQVKGSTSYFYLPELPQSGWMNNLSEVNPFFAAGISSEFYQQSLSESDKELFQKTLNAYVTHVLSQSSLLEALDATKDFFDREIGVLGLKSGAFLVTFFVLALFLLLTPHPFLSIFLFPAVFSALGFLFYCMKFVSTLGPSPYISELVVAVKNKIQDFSKDSLVIAQYMLDNPLKPLDLQSKELYPARTFCLFFPSQSLVIHLPTNPYTMHFDQQFLDRFYQVAKFAPAPKLSQRENASAI